MYLYIWMNEWYQYTQRNTNGTDLINGFLFYVLWLRVRVSVILFRSDSFRFAIFFFIRTSSFWVFVLFHDFDLRLVYAVMSLMTMKRVKSFTENPLEIESVLASMWNFLFSFRFPNLKSGFFFLSEQNPVCFSASSIQKRSDKNKDPMSLDEMSIYHRKTKCCSDENESANSAKCSQWTHTTHTNYSKSGLRNETEKSNKMMCAKNRKMTQRISWLSF